MSNYNRLSHRVVFLLLTLLAPTVIVAGLLWSISAVSMAAALPAAAILVNSDADNTVDDDLCTLREAMINANNDAPTHDDCPPGSGSDAITFAGDYTITLNGSQLPRVTTTITITGNGAENTIIQAAVLSNTTTYRVFQVSNPGNLTLEGMTVRHGRCFGSCNEHGEIGGAIYADNGILNLSNVALNGNTARDIGGGIFVNLGQTNLTNVTLNDNSSGVIGGALYTNQSETTLTNVIFDNNKAEFGGGLESFLGNISVTNVTFNNNEAEIGGGFFTIQSNSTLTNVTFSNNKADYGGGMRNAGNATLNNVNFIGNEASWHCAGMDNYEGIATLTNVIFSENMAGLNYSGKGGGMCNQYAGHATLTNITFTGNEADLGGGFYSWDSASTLNNITFSANTASSEGGGLENEKSDITLTNVTFSGNSAPEGGGIYVKTGGMISLTNVIIANSPSGGDCLVDLGSISAASSHNLIQDSASACDLINGVNNNIIGFDPMLGPLADNGGNILTHALLPGSPAINVGDNGTCPDTDQRGVFRPQNGTCDIGAVESENPQAIPLQSGWNLISSYVEPNDPLLDNLLADIVNDMVLLKNNDGQIYWPAFNIDQISNWDAGQGYWIYISIPAVLTIQGTNIDPTVTAVPLDAGWNMIAFSRFIPLDVETALQDVRPDLLLVKDDEGSVYWPDMSINEIGEMVPGRGYQLYMKNAADLNYPAN